MLNQTPYPNISRVVSGAAILYPNDGVILCDTTSAPVTMTLQEIPANNWQTTWKLYVLDNSNNAGTNNITINAPTGYTINGLTSLIIKTNGGGATITIGSNTAFFGSYYPILTIADGSGIISPTTTKITFANASVVATSPTEVSITTSGGGGGVSSVTGTAPVSVTAGATPVVSMSAANGSTDGYLTQGKYTDFDNKGEKINIQEGGTTIVTATTNIDFGKGYFDVTNPSTTNTSVKTLDSGWVELDGFAWMDAALRPKCRRLGSAIYFKGTAVVPMEDPTNAANLYQPYDATTFFYQKVQNPTTYTGADTGACSVDAVIGEITFNQGLPVLPLSVFNATNGDIIDSSYYTGWKPFYRRFYCDTSVPIVNYLQEVSVTSMLNAYITTGGVLKTSTLFDIESGLQTDGLIGSSTYRMLTPSIVQGDFIPNYIARNNTTGENAQVGSMQRYLANRVNFTGATGGVLTVDYVAPNTYIEIGQTIYTATFPANTYIEAQLTGVSGGAGTYQISSSFTYAGASSVLLLKPSNNAPMQTGIIPYTSNYTAIGITPYLYPFSMDGSKPSELGGMQIDLSGLVVFLQPI
jgi:hypothetical protein